MKQIDIAEDIKNLLASYNLSDKINLLLNREASINTLLKLSIPLEIKKKCFDLLLIYHGLIINSEKLQQEFISIISNAIVTDDYHTPVDLLRLYINAKGTHLAALIFYPSLKLTQHFYKQEINPNAISLSHYFISLALDKNLALYCLNPLLLNVNILTHTRFHLLKTLSKKITHLSCKDNIETELIKIKKMRYIISFWSRNSELAVDNTISSMIIFNFLR